MVFGFCELLGLPELCAEEFGVVLGDREFDASGIIDEVICIVRVYLTTDGLGQFYEMHKNLCEEGTILVSEAGKLGSVWNLVEAAEIPKLGA